MQDNHENRAIFATVMNGISEDFGGTLSNNNLSVRFSALQEFSVDQITKAGTWLLIHREATFPAVPTTKEFIDVIGHAGTPEPRLKAEIEADKVLLTLKEWGRDAEPLFYDQSTLYLMTRRWTFCQLDLMTVDDPGLKWWRKNFVQAYQDIEKNRLSGCDVLCLDKGENKKLQNLANTVVKRIEEVE